MSLPACINPGCNRPATHPNYVYCEHHHSTRAKLSHLRQDAANALCTFMGFLSSPTANGEEINIAALGYVSAQATYTLACGEAKKGRTM